MQGSIGGFGRITLEVKAPSLPADCPMTSRIAAPCQSRATGHQLLPARIAAVPPLQAMDAVVSDLPPAQEPGPVHRKPLHGGLKETPSDCSGQVTGGAC